MANNESATANFTWQKERESKELQISVRIDVEVVMMVCPQGMSEAGKS
jgi:hypothetical protein